MTIFKAITILILGVCIASSRHESKTRSSWIANNAMPDSIIMNMTCRTLLPPVENNPEVALTSKNTLKILNTIKPVTRAFTAMVAAKLVRVNMHPQGVFDNWPCTTVFDPSIANQAARSNKLKSAYQIMMNLKIY